MNVQTLREFDNHEKVVRLDDPETGLKGFIAIHKRRGENPCLGATRLWKYDSEEDALNDALRLSRLMTRKSALAGLPYGGGKAVLMESPRLLQNREKAFALYAQAVDRLEGLFVTGSDVGVSDDDVQTMSRNSKYIIGANVPAGYYTALGVLHGIRATLETLYGTDDIRGRSFAIQGLGKTGFELFRLLSRDAKEIIVSDISDEAIAFARGVRANIKVVPTEEIHLQKVDIFCPCALSHSINGRTVLELRCKAVVGSANNQLENNDAGQTLHKKGILYAPDYVANGGGIISVVDQFVHTKHDDLRIIDSLENIYESVKNILTESKSTNISPESVAENIAQRIITKPIEPNKLNNTAPAMPFFEKHDEPKEVLFELKTKPAVYWEEKGKDMALKLFKFAAKTVPAYQDVLRKNNIKEENIKSVRDFEKLPYVDKHSYVRAYKRTDLLPNSDVSPITTFSSTSGSTGEPTYFPRGEEQDWQYEYTAELFLRNQFDIHEKKTLGIMGFALGIWIGGVFTYKNLNAIAKKGYPLALAPVGTNKDIFLKTIKELGGDFDQIILMGYPPFLKDIIDEAEEYGISWDDYSVKILTATESFSEQFRDYIARTAKIENKYRDIINIYGTVELGTMANETALSTLIRDIAVKDKKVYQALFSDATQLPTLAQYHSYLNYFETVGEELYVSGFGSLFPLVRYRLHDRGGVIPYNDMISKLKAVGVDILQEAKKQGIDATILRLPFVYVHERSDFVIILRGANIYPENIRSGLQDERLEKMVTGKFTMLKKENDSLDEYLEAHIELKKDVVGNKHLQRDIELIIVETLCARNSEYHNSYKAEGEKLLPVIVLHEYEDPEHFGPGIKQRWVKK